MIKKFKKLVVFDNVLLTPQHRERLIQSAEIVKFYPKTEDQSVIKEQIRDADAVINCWTVITEESLKGSSVKYIGNWGHWWKHRITLSEQRLKELGIYLDYIPDYGTDAVAEIVWAGILSLARNFERWHKDAATGKWVFENIKNGQKQVDIANVSEHLITGKTLGIVGMGRIGYRVAQIGINGFGVNVLYNSRTRKKELEGENFQYVSLPELFRQSDIISVHVSPDTPKYLISKKLLESMKPGAIFVNTSTGNSIDQTALVEILKKGKIKAFLDVYEQFPPRKELKDLPNVIFTYRLGWFTTESLQRKAGILVSNIEKYLEKKH